MKTIFRIVLFASLAILLFLAACGGAATPTEAPTFVEGPISSDKAAAAPTFAPLPTSAPTAFDATRSEAGQAPLDTGGSGQVVSSADRLIVKNGDIKLLVQDTDSAIDRTTQIVGDVGGYIISSRVWYQDWYGANYKYATISIGVPVDQFESALRRLRGIAIRVEDEQEAGEDVTDQYVDLQSQLTNLEATADRIRSFLKDAKTVDEALRINQQLTDIGQQIEQVKGRINYLSNRAAYSTISITIEPQLPEITPTPTFTPTATFTPVPSATPTPWKPGQTFGQARNTLVVTYQSIIDVLIWILVVLLPILLPFALIGWGVWYFLLRKK
jgi:uncharacterized protein DUF4349